MHDHDFELLNEEPLGEHQTVFFVLIKAAGLSRRYLYDSQSDSLQLADQPIIVGGHDMTSIIGKRVREWLRSTRLAR